MSKERETYVDEKGDKRYRDTGRKVRADKGTKEPSGAASTGKGQSLAMERTEAALINAAIIALVSRKYGEAPKAPSATETDHLARVLRALGKVPPFSIIQGFLKKFIPIAGTGQGGVNPFAEAFKYLHSWYHKNPDLFDRIYVSDPTIPNIFIYPKEAVAQRFVERNGRGSVVREETVTAEETEGSAVDYEREYADRPGSDTVSAS